MKTDPAKRSPRKMLPVIGWREWILLPDIHGIRVKAKVDTGARTSSLHAFDIRRVARDGQDWVDFEVHPAQRSPVGALRVLLPVIDERRVRSSDGRSQLRPVVRVDVQVFEERWPIELTLTARDEMGFRMLLGREALRRRVLVDAGRSFLSGRPPGVPGRKKKKSVKKKIRRPS